MNGDPNPTARPVPYPAPPRPRSFWVAWILLAALLGSLFLNFVLLVMVLMSAVGGPAMHETLIEGEFTAADKILLVPVHGVLMQGDSVGGARDPVGYLLDVLDEAEKDEAVKAIVMDIDSPGGGITACDRLHHRLARFRKARPGVPIVASLGDVAASGGYYIAAGADRVFAHRSTITGSIGVIMHLVNLEGLTDKVGVRPQVVKSGPHKDIGSPFRGLTSEEQKHFQGMIEVMYEQFLGVILEGRKGAGLTREKLLALADGNVLLGDRGVSEGLVDAIGYVDDAIADARQRARAPNAKVVRFDRPPSLRDLLGVQARSGASAEVEAVARLARRFEGGARFMYVWEPGLK